MSPPRSARSTRLAPHDRAEARHVECLGCHRRLPAGRIFALFLRLALTARLRDYPDSRAAGICGQTWGAPGGQIILSIGDCRLTIELALPISDLTSDVRCPMGRCPMGRCPMGRCPVSDSPWPWPMAHGPCPWPIPKEQTRADAYLHGERNSLRRRHADCLSQAPDSGRTFAYRASWWPPWPPRDATSSPPNCGTRRRRSGGKPMSCSPAAGSKSSTSTGRSKSNSSSGNAVEVGQKDGQRRDAGGGQGKPEPRRNCRRFDCHQHPCRNQNPACRRVVESWRRQRHLYGEGPGQRRVEVCHG